MAGKCMAALFYIGCALAGHPPFDSGSSCSPPSSSIQGTACLQMGDKSARLQSSNERLDKIGACVHCPEYVSKSAREKQSTIFQKVEATEHGKLSLDGLLEACDSLPIAEGVDMNMIFDRYSDERPSDFPRFFHELGSVATIRFKSTAAHNFTGLFKGANHGVIRLTPCSPTTKNTLITEYIFGTFPFSAALKLFRNGTHSGNLLTCETGKGSRIFREQRSFFSRPNYNFFSRPVATVTDLPQELDELFGKGQSIPGVVSASDFAAFDEAGNMEPDVKVPLIVWLKPNPVLNDRFGLGTRDYREYLAEPGVEIGTTLYEVYTTVNASTREPQWCFCAAGEPCVDDDVPSACPGVSVVKLGDVISTSRFVNSDWADKYLFFQHTRVCPRNQNVCEFQSAGSNLHDQLSFASNLSRSCLANRSCPDSSTKLPAADCNRGTTLQKDVVSCPFMKMLSASIKGIDPEASRMIEKSCSPNVRWWLDPLTKVVEFILAGVAAPYRWIESSSL